MVNRAFSLVKGGYKKTFLTVTDRHIIINVIILSPNFRFTRVGGGAPAEKTVFHGLEGSKLDRVVTHVTRCALDD